MKAGVLNELVAFDIPVETADAHGGTETSWLEKLSCRAEFIYSRGGEVVDASRLAGNSVYKVKIRSHKKSRNIAQHWRLRDERRGTVYNIREVDTITDRGWIYILVQSGVAV